MSGIWNRVVVLPLCVCLLVAGSAQGAENQVLSIGASETERLRDLLIRKRIDASFTDGSYLKGRVKEIQEGLLRVDIKKSTGTNPVPRGLQNIPTDRISTVQFTRHKGYKRALLGTVFSLGGLGLGARVQTMVNENEVTATSAAAWIAVWSGMTALGYLWGRKKDKKNVTLVIQQPEASGGSP